MPRPLSIILADAFDRAARDVAEASQVHDHYKLPAPSRTDCLVYWARGFVAGLTGNHAVVPPHERSASPLRRLGNRIKDQFKRQKAR